MLQSIIYVFSEFPVSSFKRFIIRGSGMPFIQKRFVRPFRRSFHKGNSLAFDGVGNQYFGLVGDLLKAGKHILQGSKVVPVAARHMPAEDFELCLQIAQINNVF